MDRNVNRSMEILANSPFGIKPCTLLCRHCTRSSLLYAAATLTLAALSYFTVLSEDIALWCVLANILFFSFSILVYIIHGFLQDTSNQFKQPHRLGHLSLPTWLMTLMMIALIITELLATAILLMGTILLFLGK